MCRCGLSCEYIYKRLEYAEREGTGYRLSVGLAFPEEEIDKTKSQEEDIIPP
jgi:hypothetical protein